jgi:predicted Zn-dependent protease
MSWNALGKGLVTAGVMGVVAPFRYLLITPALMNLLDENEIMAVVSHEVGHVKKKHIPLYLVFLMGLMIIIGVAQDWILDFFLTTQKGLEIVFPGQNVINTGVISAISIPLLLLVFVGYFRFIFGFFMRNFERQADGYCIESGIDPNYMISSFMKLGVRLGDDGKKSNWHHFNLSQRIDYIKKAMTDPGVISRHNRGVKRGIALFAVVLILFTVVSYQDQPNLKRWAAIIEHQLESTPDDHKLYSALGQIYYQLKEWKNAKKAYEYAVGLNYQQPETLNNLAWLLLTAEDESLRDPKRALKLAKDSVEMREAAHTMDTLAEAYYQNHMYLEAVKTSKRALELATENSSYFKKQYEKMEEALQKNGFL